MKDKPLEQGNEQSTTSNMQLSRGNACSTDLGALGVGWRNLCGGVQVTAHAHHSTSGRPNPVWGLTHTPSVGPFGAQPTPLPANQPPTPLSQWSPVKPYMATVVTHSIPHPRKEQRGPGKARRQEIPSPSRHQKSSAVWGSSKASFSEGSGGVRGDAEIRGLSSVQKRMRACHHALAVGR